MQIDTDRIVRAFEENPIAFMGAAGAVLIGFSKLIEATSKKKDSRSWAREVRRRELKDIRRPK